MAKWGCEDCDSGQDRVNTRHARLASDAHTKGTGHTTFIAWPEACDCYVRWLDPDIQFCTRYGAHSLSCPLYRPSADPVDAKHDAEFRAMAEMETPEVVNARCS